MSKELMIIEKGTSSSVPKKARRKQVVVVPTRSAPRRKLKPRRPNSQQSIEKCTADYIQSLANPYTGPLACIPTYPTNNTRKFRTFIRGTFSSGLLATGNLGFVVIDPLSMCTNDNIEQCVASTATYPYNYVELNNPGSAGYTASYLSNSDYNTASFTSISENKVRVVSAGLRVQYAGSLLNVGGISYALQEPNHASLEYYTVNDFSGYNECNRTRIEPEGWISLYYKPVDNNELILRDSDYFAINPPAANFLGNLQSFMGVLVTTPIPSQLFNFEAYATFECSGYSIRGKTPGSADAQGFSRVVSVTAVSDFDHSAPNMVGAFLKRSAISIGDAAVNYAISFGKSKAQQLFQPSSIASNTRLFIS